MDRQEKREAGRSSGANVAQLNRNQRSYYLANRFGQRWVWIRLSFYAFFRVLERIEIC